ncbi:hypothetical protein BX616_007579, partial [Lobosporangium transversale]
DGERSVIYALRGELTFQTTPGVEHTQTTLSSPAIHLKYLPIVPTSIPHFPVIEMAQVMDPYTNRPLFKASLESPQRGVCPVTTPTRHCIDNYYGPGTVFQGQLNLQLAKPIHGPCRLRVVFACLHTMPPPEHIHHPPTAQPQSGRSSSTEERGRASSDSSSQGQKSIGSSHHHPPQQYSIFEIDHVFVEDEPLHVKRHAFLFNIKFPKVNMPASMV